MFVSLSFISLWIISTSVRNLPWYCFPFTSTFSFLRAMCSWNCVSHNVLAFSIWNWTSPISYEILLSHFFIEIYLPISRLNLLGLLRNIRDDKILAELEREFISVYGGIHLSREEHLLIFMLSCVRRFSIYIRSASKIFICMPNFQVGNGFGACVTSGSLKILHSRR